MNSVIVHGMACIPNRGSTIAVTGVSGLAGCSMIESFGSDDESFEADVLSKGIKLVHTDSADPEETGEKIVIRISSEDVHIGPWIEDSEEYSEGDFDADTRIRDFPWPEIFAWPPDDIKVITTFTDLTLDLHTRDGVNDNDPTVGENKAKGYTAPTQFFDHLTVDERYELRPATGGDYYTTTTEPPIADILE